MSATVYKVELANKEVRGKVVGNLYGVGRYVDGCRTGYALGPQVDEVWARRFAAAANESPEALDAVYSARYGSTFGNAPALIAQVRADERAKTPRLCPVCNDGDCQTKSKECGK